MILTSDSMGLKHSNLGSPTADAFNSLELELARMSCIAAWEGRGLARESFKTS
jgi:hypothetical protein